VDPEGREVTAESASFLVKAQSRSLSKDDIKAELSSLGGSVYELVSFECLLPDGLFLNHRDLKGLRKNLVERINTARTTPKAITIRDALPQAKIQRAKLSSRLNILLRKKEQVDGFANAFKNGFFNSFDAFINSVILDFEFGKDYAASVAMIKELGLPVGIATTRILKPQEYHNLRMISRLNPDMILARNLGAIEFLKRETKIPLIGDFSLNVTNSLTSAYLLDKGLESVNLSYDLNQDQLIEVIENSDPGKLEVTLHQYMPEFHMEHCVFAAFLSTGHSFRDCGKPCEKHEVKLKDPYGNWHFLKADQECRNTFFKATPQSASFMTQKLSAMGLGFLRIEALDEKSDELNKKIKVYLQLLAGQMSSEDAVQELMLFEGYGLSQGQMKKTDSYRDRKKEI